jgi:GTP-binding protein
MPLPRIAIVGRPNVGKSSLMNMIAGAKISIVDPTPGVTRDRVSAIVDLESPFRGGASKPVEFTDTGGFGAYFEPTARFDEIGNDLRRLTHDIENQIGQAISGADLILFCVDSQAGITPADEQIARLLREQKLGKRTRKDGSLIPVQVVATKVDGPRWEMHAHEFSAFGFGQPLMCSSKNNYMRRDLLDALWELMPEHEDAADEKRSAQHADLKIAIIGKRNAGKSTLVNQIAGEERVIVSEIPGTTRDAIDVRIEKDGKTLVLVDTAGLRRKKSFQGQVEWYAFDRLQRAVDRADVVLLLVDATTKISQVDEQVAMIAQKAFKPVIVGINKWDLAEGQPGRSGKPVTVEDYEKYVRRELRGMDFAPIAFMSGQSGLNVSETIDLAWELFEQSHQRVSTGKLNRLFRKIVELRGPTSKTGQVAKVYYVAQTGVAPPTITLVVNFPELFTPNYQRFLLNRLRENSDFVEVPIRLNIRDRKRTLQSERGAEVEGGDDRFNPDATEDQLRKDALIGMRAAAREAVGSGADAYFDEPIPELRPAPTRSGPRVPRIDDDLDEAALERALAEMEVRALGSIEPEEGGDFPAAARDEDDAGESDDQMDAEPPAEPTFTASDEYEAEDQPRTTKGTSKPKASAKPAPQAGRGRKPAPGPGSTLAAKPTAKPASKPAARKPSGKKPAAKPAAKSASKSASKPASKLASRTSSRPAPKAGAAKKAAGSKAASRTSAPKKPGSKPAAAKKSAAAKSGKRR